MAYVHKVIGHDEKLIGVAQLHWIYLVKGFFMFLACVLFGWGLDHLLIRTMAYITQGMANGAYIPFMAVNLWLLPGAIVIGFVLMSFYITKILTTEVGLTNKRIVYKTGWLFVNVKEIDIEEIRGENLDTGWLGRFLDYGYVNLDCRFIGDIKLPAIAKANTFLKALHKMRSDVIDTVTMVVGNNRAAIVQVEDGQDTPPPTHNMNTPDLKTEDDMIRESVLKDMEVRKIMAEKNALEEQLRVVAEDHPAPPPAPRTDLPKPDIAPPVDAQMVADIVEQVMPQMVEKMTEQMIAKGLVAKVPKKKAEDILTTFDTASGLPPDEPDRLNAEPVVH